VSTPAPGHDPGHELSWGDYVAWLVETHGSLSAVAKKLSAHRAWSDDAGSIERALRRLRGRGQSDGGTWGERALGVFGLPGGVDARLRWMGAYHSRFTDLPLPLCRDLLRVWDRPPMTDSKIASTWLALGHATSALRGNEPLLAVDHLRRASATRKHAPAEARIELLLVEAFVASRTDKEKASALLDDADPLLDEPMPAYDRACLRARLVDQRAYDLSKRREYAEAEALYRTIPTEGAPPFARCRRASGLAHARLSLGHREEAIALSREACDHAGDGGHLRLRAMSLSMLARALGEDEGKDAHRRAVEIARALDDEGLRLRFTGSDHAAPGWERRDRIR
jgi:hypothetical protein